jgi:hypothetical protein
MPKIWNKTGISALAGLLAYIVTVLVLFIPYKGETAVSAIDWRSPLGLVFIGLFSLSVILYSVSIFKRDLDFFQKKSILEQRQEYLPLLRETIEQIIVHFKELSKEAGKLPLESYFDKYLKLNSTYQRIFNRLPHKDLALRREIAICLALQSKLFFRKNTYLYELESKDTALAQLMNTCKAYLARLDKNKPLSANIKVLFKRVRSSASMDSMADLSINNDLKYKDPKDINVFYEKPRWLDTFVEDAHKQVVKDIDALLMGEDL